MEDLRIGDVVKSYDFKTGQFVNGRVSNLSIFKNAQHQELHLPNCVLIVGDDQFFIKQEIRRYCFELTEVEQKAQHLKPSESFLFSRDPFTTTPLKLVIHKSKFGSDITLICPEVEPYHNYIVTDNQYLVSNFSGVVEASLLSHFAGPGLFIASGIGSTISSAIGAGILPGLALVLLGYWAWKDCTTYTYDRIQQECRQMSENDKKFSEKINTEYLYLFGLRKQYLEQQAQFKWNQELERMKKEEELRLLKEDQAKKAAAEACVENPTVAEGSPPPEPPKKPDGEDENEETQGGNAAVEKKLKELEEQLSQINKNNENDINEIKALLKEVKILVEKNSQKTRFSTSTQYICYLQTIDYCYAKISTIFSNPGQENSQKRKDLLLDIKMTLVETYREIKNYFENRT